jgi:MSHA biogenesis protein MshK
MAERLKPGMFACALVAAFSSAVAAAQARLIDPTRPPQSAPAPDEPGKPTDQKAAKSAPRLQSILISPQRKLAVIDGRTVPLGGEVNGARVVAITERGVTLRRGAQTETLRLNPGVEKKAVAE